MWVKFGAWQKNVRYFTFQALSYNSMQCIKCKKALSRFCVRECWRDGRVQKNWKESKRAALCFISLKSDWNPFEENLVLPQKATPDTNHVCVFFLCESWKHDSKAMCETFSMGTKQIIWVARKPNIGLLIKKKKP